MAELKELAQHMVELRDQIDALRSETTDLQKEYDQLRKVTIPELMESMGIENVKIEGVGRLSLRQEAYCSVRANMKDALLRWLDDHGHNELVSETVNSSTLKAWVKAQLAEGLEIPPDEIINFDPFEMATITKG